LPNGVEQLAGGALSHLGASLAGALQKVAGQSIEPAAIEKIVAQVLAEHTAPAKGNGHSLEAAAATPTPAEVAAKAIPPAGSQSTDSATRHQGDKRDKKS